MAETDKQCSSILYDVGIAVYQSSCIDRPFKRLQRKWLKDDKTLIPNIENWIVDILRDSIFSTFPKSMFKLDNKEGVNDLRGVIAKFFESCSPTFIVSLLDRESCWTAILMDSVRQNVATPSFKHFGDSNLKENEPTCVDIAKLMKKGLFHSDPKLKTSYHIFAASKSCPIFEILWDKLEINTRNYTTLVRKNITNNGQLANHSSTDHFHCEFAIATMFAILSNEMFLWKSYKVLPRSYNFTWNFDNPSVELFAQLRLLNQSALKSFAVTTRALNLSVYTSVVTCTIPIDDNGLQINVVEQHNISKEKKWTEVMLAGSYTKDIIPDLQKMAVMCGKSPGDIAYWIELMLRKGGNAEFKKLSKNFHSIYFDWLSSNIPMYAYLFFACETARSPSVGITIRMLLDLVRCGRFPDWREAFDTFPAADKEVIDIMRWQHTTYKKGYQYDISRVTKKPSGAENFIGKESRTLHYWLRYSLKNCLATNNNGLTEDERKYLLKLHSGLCLNKQWTEDAGIFFRNMVSMACERWYGFAVTITGDKEWKRSLAKKVVNNIPTQPGKFSEYCEMLSRYVSATDTEIDEDIIEAYMQIAKKTLTNNSSDSSSMKNTLKDIFKNMKL